METQVTLPPKPKLLQVIIWTTLASGILNLLWGMFAVSAVWWTVICIPFAVLPTVLGIFEIVYAAKLMSNPPQAVQPSTTIAILEILCVLAGNAFAVVVGILALVFYNDAAVSEYFARLNGTPGPVVPVTPVAPVPPAPPAPAPAPEAPPAVEEVAPPVEPPAPEPAPEEPPQKPRRPRKVAGK